MAYQLLGPGEMPDNPLLFRTDGSQPTPFPAGAGSMEGGDTPLQVYPWGGIDYSFFVSDQCPNCGKVHRFYAPPLPDPGNPAELLCQFPCFAGPGGAASPVNMRFIFTENTAIPQNVLTAIARGLVVSP